MYIAMLMTGWGSQAGEAKVRLLTTHPDTDSLVDAFARWWHVTAAASCGAKACSGGVAAEHDC
jgi:hypothetical protein